MSEKFRALNQAEEELQRFRAEQYLLNAVQTTDRERLKNLHNKQRIFLQTEHEKRLAQMNDIVISDGPTIEDVFVATNTAELSHEVPQNTLPTQQTFDKLQKP